MSGVIDWGDMCRSDPAIDLMLVWILLLPAGLEPRFVEAYGPIDDEQALRARVLALFLGLTLALYARDVGHAALERECARGPRPDARRLVGDAAFEDRGEARGVDVPAGDDAHHATLTAEPGQRRRDGSPAAPSPTIARSFQQRPHSSCGVRERDRECVRDELTRVLPHPRQERPEPAPSMKDGVYSIFTGSRPFRMAAVTGAPVSGSQTKIFVCGRSARTALAIPVVSPPPPHGMRTASKSSRSSTSSRPMVPLPAITGGSWTGWTKKPSTPSPRSRSPSASTAAHHCSHDTRTILPPRRSTAASFVSEALSGTTIVAGTPSSRAIQATPCAMFPVLVVTRPSRSWSGGALSTAFAAPRSLKDAIGCRFSSFSQISAGASTRRRTSGVRMTVPAIPLARGLDVRQRDQNGTSTPTPRSRAVAR